MCRLRLLVQLAFAVLLVAAGCARTSTPPLPPPPADSATLTAFRELNGGFGLWVSARTARRQAGTEAKAAEFAEFLQRFGVRMVLVESRTLQDEVIFLSATHRALDGDDELLTRLAGALLTRGIGTVAVVPLFLGVPVDGEQPIEAGLDASSGRLRLLPRGGSVEGPSLPYRSLFSGEVRQRAASLLAEVSRVEGVNAVCLTHAGYASHNADFHREAHTSFEQFLGQPLTRWPEPLLLLEVGEEGPRVIPGPLWNLWKVWRTGVVSTLLFQYTSIVRRESDAHFGDASEVSLLASGYLDQQPRTGVNWTSAQLAEDPGVAELFDRLFLEAYAPILARAEARENGIRESASLEAVLATSEALVPPNVERWVVLSVIPYLNEDGRLGTEGRRKLRTALRLTRSRGVPVILLDYEILQRETAWEDVRAALTLR